MLKKTYVLVLLIISILIFGCGKDVNMISPPVHTTTSTVPIVTLTATAIPITSTLSFDQAESELQNLLSNNGGCNLPCFWGITSGNSVFQELVSILSPLSGLSTFTQFESHNGTISPEYVNEDLISHLSVQYLADPSTQVVTSLSFSAVAFRKIDDTYFKVFDSLDFDELINYYKLNNILSIYGRPNTVMISTMSRLPSSGDAQGGFNMILLYPEQGIFAYYNMEMVVVGNDIMGCPSKSHVELKLSPLNEIDLFFTLLDERGWQRLLYNVYKPIDEVASITTNEFYETFSQPTDECILTPANLWPTPD